MYCYIYMSPVNYNYLSYS